MTSQLISQTRKLNNFIEPIQSSKRPKTKPSVLFDAKQAADIDIDTIYSIAVSGWEVLEKKDEKYSVYKKNLFSDRWKDKNRELMSLEENKKLDEIIGSYLRLLSGDLVLAAALKTLEYLIRRYKVHVNNIDELILCALPYHDTPAFVRIVQIVQIVQLRNSKWHFLEAVQVSGAPPPRRVIVQQCIRDMGVLDALCGYASPRRKNQPSSPVVSFVTVVVVEILGSLPTIDTDTVRRILPFVYSWLEHTSKGGARQKAGALMIIGSLAKRSTLAPKAVKALIELIARAARQDAEDSKEMVVVQQDAEDSKEMVVVQQDAKESEDWPWLRMSLVTIINLVQSQSVQVFPKKALDSLSIDNVEEIGDVAVVLSGLSKEFNIKKFLSIYVEALANYSMTDVCYRRALASVIKIIPVEDFIGCIVSKVLTYCKTEDNFKRNVSGDLVNEFLAIVGKHYPSELREAVRNFQEDSKLKSQKGDSKLEILGSMFSEGQVSHDLTDPKIWLSLEHPMAEVRCATLSSLARTGILKAMNFDTQKHVSFQEALLRRLNDEDLSVVQAALSLDGISKFINASDLLKAYSNILQRVVDTVMTGHSHGKAEACEVAKSCLDGAILNLQKHYLKEVAAMMFPLILIMPKTQQINLKALELVKHLQWPFYSNISGSYVTFSQIQDKKLEVSVMNSTNISIIEALSLAFSEKPEEYITWLVDCYNGFELSKTLLLLIILQSFTNQNIELGTFSALFRTCLPVVKQAWTEVECTDGDFPSIEYNTEKLGKGCDEFLGQLINSKSKTMKTNLLICIYWRILKSFLSVAPLDSSENHGEWLQIRDDLFVLFASSHFKGVFREHLRLLVKNCTSPASFLSKFFTEEGYPIVVQIESLLQFATLCHDSALSKSRKNIVQEFPTVLLPLSSDNKDVRKSAMKCLEGIAALQYQVDNNTKKKGNDILASGIWTRLGELIGLIVEQKRLIISDPSFLRSFLTSVLASSSYNLMVPKNVNQRFDSDVKVAILQFILNFAFKLSAHGRLMLFSIIKGTGNAIFNVEGVNSLLSELLERRNHYHLRLDRSYQALSKIEIDTLCCLLECLTTTGAEVSKSIQSDLMMGLHVTDVSTEDDAITLPCITVLHNLNPSVVNCLNQDQLFDVLVHLFRSDNGNVQNAARDALLQINVSCSTVVRAIDNLVASLSGTKKKKSRKQNTNDVLNLSIEGETKLHFLSSLIDVLLLKKDIKERDSLIWPLFELLRKIFTDKSLLEHDDEQQKLISDKTSYIQQALLVVLEDICASLVPDILLKGKIVHNFDVELLADIACEVMDAVTRNHVFSLLTSIAKVNPLKVLEQKSSILIAIGQSAIVQDDGHSRHVFEELLSTIIPYWMSQTDSSEKLLQNFVDVLPQVSECRRLTIMLHLLRILGEENNLASVIVLLIRSLALKTSTLFSENHHNMLDSCDLVIQNEWEYAFATQLYEQYSCMIWLPSLVVFLQRIRMDNQSQQMTEVLVGLKFVLKKLQNTELAFKLESREDSSNIQKTLGALMEQVVLHIQLANPKKLNDFPMGLNKDLKKCMQTVLKNIVNVMVPSAFFNSISLLLGNKDRIMGKKALGILCETVKDLGTVIKKQKLKKRLGRNSISSWLHLDEDSQKSFNDMCSKIVELIDSSEDDTNSPIILAAVSAIEVVVNKYPSDNPIYIMCLTSVVKHMRSSTVAVTSGCLRTISAIIIVLGPKALSELPHIIRHMVTGAWDAINAECLLINPVLYSVLVTLESIVEKLGAFLNPYLQDILDLLVLHPEYIGSDLKMKNKADAVRKLVTEKIPARLTLKPLLESYPKALKSGDSELSVTFGMLANIIGSMDRSSVVSSHGKILEQCLVALDLRRTHPDSITNIISVEQSVIDAMIVLTKKLSETMFRPLFSCCLQWVDTKFGEKVCLSRAISFYRFINELTDCHRSLFVPYFKELVGGSINFLTNVQETQFVGLTQKKKKAKIDGSVSKEEALSTEQWHLRALIISAFHKCFLYDTGGLKFLDAKNFEVLLKPLVSQLVAEPPEPTLELSDVPSLREVDDSLVVCLGHMAVAVGSDLLWKPLNHDVLMQTRSEKVRARILGLRVVKYFLDHLKNEYLMLLPETIPFLAELLEDVELPVKTLAQEIFKEMESLSGENLKEYL